MHKLLLGIGIVIMLARFSFVSIFLDCDPLLNTNEYILEVNVLSPFMENLILRKIHFTKCNIPDC